MAEKDKKNLPIPVPVCHQNSGHGQMVYNVPHTPEQKWVGASYSCRTCGAGTLFESKELLEERKRAELRHILETGECPKFYNSCRDCYLFSSGCSKLNKDVKKFLAQNALINMPKVQK